jgi:hypothetical protein
MGTIETSIDLDKGLTVHTVFGETSADEIRRRITSYYEGDVTHLLLWDFTNADVASGSAANVRDLVELTNELTKRRHGGKTALVFSSSFAYGMGRMYELSKEIGDPMISHGSFRDLNAALEWLGIPAGDE